MILSCLNSNSSFSLTKCGFLLLKSIVVFLDCDPASSYIVHVPEMYLLSIESRNVKSFFPLLIAAVK
jgi:hypothetical protein